MTTFAIVFVTFVVGVVIGQMMVLGGVVTKDETTGGN